MVLMCSSGLALVVKELLHTLVRCRRRTKQAIDKHVERYVVPFSGWEAGGSPVPRWWEPPPAPTRVVLDPAASPPPMCDGSGAGFGF